MRLVRRDRLARASGGGDGATRSRRAPGSPLAAVPSRPARDGRGTLITGPRRRRRRMHPSREDTKAVRRGAALLVAATVAVIAETFIDPANSDDAAKIYIAAAAHPGRMIGCAYLL